MTQSVQQGQQAGRNYTNNNTAPSEKEPAVSWWQKPIRFCVTYSNELGAAASVLSIVNSGINLISKIWGLGKKNVPEAKRNEGLS
ncbi:MAG: hypothetical protein AB4063_25010 [Crocosphaera sp.]